VGFFGDNDDVSRRDGRDVLDVLDGGESENRKNFIKKKRISERVSWPIKKPIANDDIFNKSSEIYPK